jgi:hypothetical protein
MTGIAKHSPRVTILEKKKRGKNEEYKEYYVLITFPQQDVDVRGKRITPEGIFQQTATLLQESRKALKEELGLREYSDPILFISDRGYIEAFSWIKETQESYQTRQRDIKAVLDKKEEKLAKKERCKSNRIHEALRSIQQDHPELFDEYVRREVNV